VLAICLLFVVTTFRTELFDTEYVTLEQSIDLFVDLEIVNTYKAIK